LKAYYPGISIIDQKCIEVRLAPDRSGKYFILYTLMYFSSPNLRPSSIFNFLFTVPVSGWVECHHQDVGASLPALTKSTCGIAAACL